MINPKIVFFGSSDFSVFCLEELKNLNIVPALIITSVDKPVGRKLTLKANPVKIWANENNVNFLTPARLDSDFISSLKAINCELFLVASYGKIIPQAVLDLPKYGTLNIHPSLLPKYRGASPLQFQILNDEKNVGLTIMLLDEQMDHGPIVIQEKIEIKNWPVNFITLEKTLAQAGAQLFAKILPEWITNKVKAEEQNHDQATFTKKVEKADGELDIINGDPYKNYLKYLAYSESPRVYSFALKGEKKIRFIITDAEYKDGQFIIKTVLPEGKKEMNYGDFLRGLK